MPRTAKYNNLAGYIASRVNPFSGDDNVLFHAREAGLDESGGLHVTSCMAHGTICNHPNRATAYAMLPTADWCEACQAIKHGPRAALEFIRERLSRGGVSSDEAAKMVTLIERTERFWKGREAA